MSLTAGLLIPSSETHCFPVVPLVPVVPDDPVVPLDPVVPDTPVVPLDPVVPDDPVVPLVSPPVVVLKQAFTVTFGLTGLSCLKKISPKFDFNKMN